MQLLVLCLVVSTNVVPSNRTIILDHVEQHLREMTRTQLPLHDQSCIFVHHVHLSNRRRYRRDINAGKIDVRALQTTINDHRVILNQLVNNSINATELAYSVRNEIRREPPSITNWRDIVDLLFISIVLVILLRYVLSRNIGGIGVRLMSMMGLHKIEQKRPKENEQDKSPSTDKVANAIDPYRDVRVPRNIGIRDPSAPMPLHTISERVHYNSGYLSD
jgi:hypothetical protein